MSIRHFGGGILVRAASVIALLSLDLAGVGGMAFAQGSDYRWPPREVRWVRR